MIYFTFTDGVVITTRYAATPAVVVTHYRLRLNSNHHGGKAQPHTLAVSLIASLAKPPLEGLNCL